MKFCTLRKTRKKKPIFIHILRKVVIASLLIFLVMYIYSIYKKIINDQFIVIQENHVIKEEIPVPGMCIYMKKRGKIFLLKKSFVF